MSESEPYGGAGGVEATDDLDAVLADLESASQDTGVSRPRIQREYYSIGEVCELVDLKPHVLRYWESQFPPLNPSKNRSGNRVYRRKEIQLIELVKHLLYEEKYTIEGARLRLEQLRRQGELMKAARAALDGHTLDAIRAELVELQRELTVDAND